MKPWNVLSEADIARSYVERRGGYRNLPGTATWLVDDIKDFLQTSGLGHRADDAIDIAIEAVEIVKQAQIHDQIPVQAEAQAAFRANVEGGTTASDAELAQYVAGLDINQYAAERERLGVAHGLGAFLGGS